MESDTAPKLEALASSALLIASAVVPQGSGHVGDFLFGAGKILAALFGGRGNLSD